MISEKNVDRQRLQYRQETPCRQGGRSAWIGVVATTALAALVALPLGAQAQRPGRAAGSGTRSAPHTSSAHNTGGGHAGGGQRTAGDRGGAHRYQPGNRGGSHHDGHRYRSGGYRYVPRLGFSYGYPYRGGPWGYYGYGWGGYGYGDGYVGPGSVVSPNAGAVDVNVRPQKAQLYLDGSYIGIADNYDGFPRYLWLEGGLHRLVIYLDGYQTLAKRIQVRAGEVIDLRDRMVPGKSTSPEELLEQTEPRADRGVEGEARRTEPAAVRPRAGRPEPGRPADVDRVGGLSSDVRRRPARLRLIVEPADAVVYLDGRLLGSGEELDRLHSDLVIDPGPHRLEVTRPGFQTREIEFDAAENQELELEARLSKAGG